MSNAAPKGFNQSIAKAFTILEHFSPAKPAWGVRELAQTLGANKSTTYRLLATLEELNVLQQDPISEKYSLGLKLFELGNRVDIQNALVRQTHPELEKVAAEIAETVHLGILKETGVFMIDKVEGSQGLKLNSRVGETSPAYCTGLGKVLLAHLAPARLTKIIKTIKLTAKTEFTIRHKVKLREALAQIKSKGYAIDREELELGLICVAVPVFNQQNQLVAALSAAGPANRFREEALQDYVSILQEGARAIQAKIGKFRQLNEVV